MRSIVAMTPLLSLFLLPLAAADPAPPSGPMAPTSTPILALPALVLSPGLDLSGVKSSSVMVLWDEDEHGRVEHVHFPPTGSAAVDAAIRASIDKARRPSDRARPSTEFAHVFFFPSASEATMAGSGPMVPSAGPVAPQTPAPAGDRPFPLLASDPTRLIDDITDQDFPGLRPKDVAGKTFRLQWTVDETGTVTDASVSPAGFPVVDDGLIRHVVSLRYLPSVKDGKPRKALLSHVYAF